MEVQNKFMEHTQKLRSVKFSYLKQTESLLRKNGVNLSNRRLRRCAYLVVRQQNYKSYQLYNNYKKIVNSDAANNQTIAIIIVVGIITTLVIYLIL